jgi:F-type H+-transporting ATPase subunit b
MDQTTVEFQVADLAPSEGQEPEHGAAPESEYGSSPGHVDAGHEAKPGLPQLDTSTFASQLFWLIITFSFLYWVMSRIALPRLQGVILDRRNKIQGDLDEAAGAKRASEAALANYDKALADARAKALKLGDELRNKAQAEANARNDAVSKQLAADTQKAEARIGEMRAGAMSRLAVIARDTAAEIVEKLTGEIANAGEVDAAITTALKRT